MAETEPYFEPIQDPVDEILVERAKKIAHELFENLPSVDTDEDAPRVSRFVRRGQGEPELSGIRVTELQPMPDAGKIRASQAIESFMRSRNGRASESALMELLTAAGFGEKKAYGFLQEACDEKTLSKNGHFYTWYNER